MKASVAVGGPVGIFTAMALARRGYDVVLADREPGPAPDGGWDRKGVMQFRAPARLPGRVRQALAAELPDVLDALVDAGVRVGGPPGCRIRPWACSAGGHCWSPCCGAATAVRSGWSG